MQWFGVGESQGVGHCRLGDLAAPHVQAVLQTPIGSYRFDCPQVGQLEHVRECGVVESLCGSARHGTRHVGHAIMNDVVDDVGRFSVGGGPRGLGAAALVDGHVHDH